MDAARCDELGRLAVLKGLLAFREVLEDIEELFLDILLFLLAQLGVVGPHNDVNGLGLRAFFTALYLNSRHLGYQLV